MANGLRNFSCGAAVTAAAAVLIGICNYLTRRELSFQLTQANFGLLYGSVALFNLLISILDCGLNNTLTLRLAQFEAQNDRSGGGRILRKVLVFKIVTAPVLALVLWFLAEPLCTGYFHYGAGAKLFRIAVLYCLSWQIAQVSVAALSGLRAFFLMNLVQFSFYFPSLLLLFFFRGQGAAGAVSCFIFGGFAVVPCAALVLVLLLRVRQRSGSGGAGEDTSFRGLFTVGKWFLLGNILLTLLASCDMLVTSGLLGAAAAGVYSIAVAVSMIAAPLTLAANLSLPIIAGSWKRGETGEIRRVVAGTLAVWSVLFWGGALFFMLFSREVIVLLFSEKFSAGAPALAVLGTAALLNPLTLFFYGVLNGVDEQRRANLLLLPGVAANLGAALLLVRSCGIVGAAWGTFAGYLVALLLLERKIRTRVGRPAFPLAVNLVGGLLLGAGGPAALPLALGWRVGVWCVCVLLLTLPAGVFIGKFVLRKRTGYGGKDDPAL